MVHGLSELHVQVVTFLRLGCNLVLKQDPQNLICTDKKVPHLPAWWCGIGTPEFQSHRHQAKSEQLRKETLHSICHSVLTFSAFGSGISFGIKSCPCTHTNPKPIYSIYLHVSQVGYLKRNTWVLLDDLKVFCK